MRKILHLENKTTNEHRYYGSLVALCRANESLIPKAFYHTLKRLKFETPYETENYIIRLGSLQTPSDVEAGKITANVSQICVRCLCALDLALVSNDANVLLCVCKIFNNYLCDGN